MPKTFLGKLSTWLILAMPILFFIGSISANTLYKTVPAEDTALLDLTSRPILATSMLLGMLCGLTSFFLGLYSVIRQRERSPFVYIAITIGAFLLLLLVGEFIFPH